MGHPGGDKCLSPSENGVEDRGTTSVHGWAEAAQLDLREREPLQKEKQLQRPFPVPVHLGPLTGQARSGQFLTSFCSCPNFPEALTPGCNGACMRQTTQKAWMSPSALFDTYGRVVDAQMHRADLGSGCPCQKYAICPWPILNWQTDGTAAELPRAPHQQ